MTLRRLGESLAKAVSKLGRVAFIDRKVIKEVIRDIQRALLMADVSVELVVKLSENIEKRVFEEEVPLGFTRRDIALKVVYEELLKLLGGEKSPEIRVTKKPYVVMLVGIQGSGKTTSAAKLAYFFKNQGLKTALICADNFRPGALVQLKQLAEPYGVPVYGDPQKDPVKVVKEGIEYFTKGKFDMIIVDTAGRHKEEAALINEMKALAKAITPDEVMLVIDATMGKQAGVQALHFHKATPIGSIFLTKLDGAAKGGGALAAIVATGAKIKFIGVGEKVEEIEVFEPTAFVNRLLGMGDLRALVDKIRAYKALEKDRIERILSGKFTLLDFKEQLRAMRKMGPLSKILELLPGGLAFKVSSAELQLTETKIKKWMAALDSMTEEELLSPSIIDRSRIRRIAKGAGVTTKDIKDLLTTYNLIKKQLKRVSKRRFKYMQSFFGV